MVAAMSTDSSRKRGGARAPVLNRAPKVVDSPFEQARKRLEKLGSADALPAPPSEVTGLRSTRALADWEDLMLCQDADEWGSIDLSIAAQLVCVQELCRSLQFEVQVLDDMTQMDRWGNEHPSAAFRSWNTAIVLLNRLRGSLGIMGSSVADPSQRKANRKAKNVLMGVARASKAPATAPAPDDKRGPAGTDITA